MRKVQPHMSGVDEGRLCEVRPIPHSLYSSRRRDHQPAILRFIAVHHSHHHGHLLVSHVFIFREEIEGLVFLIKVSYATLNCPHNSKGTRIFWCSGVCVIPHNGASTVRSTLFFLASTEWTQWVTFGLKRRPC